MMKTGNEKAKIRQLEAFYALDCVREVLFKTGFASKNRSGDRLIKLAARFDFYCSEKSLIEVDEKTSKLLAVAENIISRGVPTRIGYDSEYYFGVKKGLYDLTKDATGKLGFKLKDGELNSSLIWQAIDLFKQPGLNTKEEFCVRAPLILGRFQKSLVHLIRLGFLNLKAKEWNIFLKSSDNSELFIQALRETQLLLKALYTIAGVRIDLPLVNIVLNNNEDYLIINGRAKRRKLLKDESRRYDLALDFELFEEFNKNEEFLINELTKTIKSKNQVIIRSAKEFLAMIPIVSAKKINYKPFREYDKQLQEYVTTNKDAENALGYLLKSIFRIENFRERQLDVLNLALGQKNVISLMPTGAGKSLVFQLAGLLQPGVTLIVEPLKSLMKDQLQNLYLAGITKACVVDSDVSASDRKGIFKRFEEGAYQYIYVSPERFQITEFRETLARVYENKVVIQYGVIDEAHCVSEWGHDFRISYLYLGANLRRYVGGSDNATLIALTGTASYDVLSDIQRELEIKSRLHVITPKDFKRKELKFIVRGVKLDVDDKTKLKTRVECLNKSLEEIPHLLGHDESFTEFITKDTKNTGIIFCPHAKGAKGVNDSLVYNKTKGSKEPVKGFFSLIKQAHPSLAQKIGKYTGQDNSKDNDENQNKFKKDEIGVLVATKAFGMGVDKPNIRFTVHTYLPGSIEAFYQEAGRAGRDRNPAVCIILFGRGQKKWYSDDYYVQGYFHQQSYPAKTVDLNKILTLLHMKSLNESLEAKGPSISDLLKAIKDGERKDVTISLTYNACASFVERLLEIADLNRNSKYSEDLNLKEELIKTLTRLYEIFKNRTGTKTESFIFTAKKELTKHKLEFEEYEDFTENELRDAFEKNLTFAETMKAIYRLSVIGVVIDYSIDYKNNTVTLEIERKNPRMYARILSHYIARYESRSYEKMLRIDERVSVQSLIIAIEKAVEILINFTYDKIATKREAQIDIMYRSLANSFSVDDEGKKAVSENFEDEIYQYFEAKYADDLRKDVCQGFIKKEQFLDWAVTKLTKDTSGGYQDNLSHLRGSCNRLLPDYPNNPILYFLRAYATYLNSALDVKQAQHDYAKALVLFEEQTKAGERMMNGMRATFRNAVLTNCVLSESALLSEKLEIEDLVIELKEAKNELKAKEEAKSKNK